MRVTAYDPAVINVYTEVAEVLELGAGVCQDFAHLFVAAARAMGVPARYVSGATTATRPRRGASTWAPRPGR